MKRLFSIVFLLVALFATASAQYFPVDTARLNSAYKELMRSPQSPEKQKEFFNAFPRNWTEYFDTYKKCKRKYPQMMKRMAGAFENFNDGVLFISEFYDWMKDKE